MTMLRHTLQHVSAVRRVNLRMLLATAAVIAASFFAFVAPASAGEFFERNGVAIDGFDPVAYFTKNAAVKGDKQFTATFQDSVFHFSSAEHRDLFVAAPEKYAPQYSGFCAYGVSQGAKVKIEGERFAVVDGKLYLNFDKGVQEKWVKDVPGYIKLADQKWPDVR